MIISGNKNLKVIYNLIYWWKIQKNYIINYIDEFNLAISKVKSQKKEIEKIYETLVKFQNKKNVHVFGNGESTSIASHFSMDLTNNPTSNVIVTIILR